MPVLFCKYLVWSIVHFMNTFLRVLDIHGTREALNILVLVSAYLFKTSKNVFSNKAYSPIRFSLILLSNSLLNLSLLKFLVSKYDLLKNSNYSNYHFVKIKKTCCYGYHILKAQ